MTADQIATLYEREYDRILRLLQRRCGNRAVAEDLASRTFEKATSAALGMIDIPDEDEASKWLSTIAINLYRNHVRDVARAGGSTAPLDAIPEPAGDDDPEETAVAFERAGALRDAIGRIPAPRQRQAAMFLLEGYDAPQIAVAMGVSPVTARSFLQRARRRLREDHGLRAMVGIG